jgi:hypothetical protein
MRSRPPRRTQQWHVPNDDRIRQLFRAGSIRERFGRFHTGAGHIQNAPGGRWFSVRAAAKRIVSDHLHGFGRATVFFHRDGTVFDAVAGKWHCSGDFKKIAPRRIQKR